MEESEPSDDAIAAQVGKAQRSIRKQSIAWTAVATQPPATTAQHCCTAQRQLTAVGSIGDLLTLDARSLLLLELSVVEQCLGLRLVVRLGVVVLAWSAEPTNPS